MNDPNAPAAAPPVDFIRAIVEKDAVSGRHGGRVATRFPPEPNGYLHIGHAKSICLNFGVAQEYGGTCNLRFDDTNPAKEDVEYVDAIKEDVEWLGFEWDALFYASDYFEQLYEFAVELIKGGKAYVDSLTGDQIREYRGTLTEPGTNSPYRDRPVDENLDLFARMRAGEFHDGAHVLRAKIDMASPNINMRDPTLYRIRHATHHRTGDAWCIYPMYDYAHPLSDAIERITHSLCTLEFEDHRPLYDWLVANGRRLERDRPQQIEFARLNLNYTVMSKRKLLQLVQQKIVSGWDDPRMPTITGLRRRGYTPESIRDFCARIGVAKKENVIDMALLEHAMREDLNARAPRVMAVLRPLKVVITNYPEGQAEDVDVINNPEDASAGTRKVPFSRVLYIERDDFKEDPPKKFFRLSPGNEVRLRYAYFITCTEVVKDDRGEVVELRCTYDPATRGGDSPDGRRVKATLHWVSAAHAIGAEVRLYDRLFSVEDPERAPDGKTFLDAINPQSLEVLHRLPGRAEPRVRGAWHESSIRASRLLLRRSRLEAGRARVQSDGVAPRCLDQDRTERHREEEMNTPQRQRGTEKHLALCLASAFLFVQASFSAASSPDHPGKLDVLTFHSRILDADRTVRVWQPDHMRRGVRYSVLYLNDGQNLFRGGDPDSGGGGWRVDDTAARLMDGDAVVPLIVVGIDNAGDESRGIDYLPPTADRYLQFVIDELMPFINTKYSTLTGPSHTGFGGSSYGAACALYAALSRPGVFGRLLLESPSVGAGNGVMMEEARKTASWPERIVIGIGTEEGRPSPPRESPGRSGQGRGPNGVEALGDVLKADGLGDDRLKMVGPGRRPPQRSVVGIAVSRRAHVLVPTITENDTCGFVRPASSSSSSGRVRPPSPRSRR